MSMRCPVLDFVIAIYIAQAKLSEIDFQTISRRPKEFDAKRVQAAYYAMIELIDDNVGRMLRHTRTNGTA